MATRENKGKFVGNELEAPVVRPGKWSGKLVEKRQEPESKRATVDPLVKKFADDLMNLRQGAGVRDLDNITRLSQEFRLACGASLDTNDLHAVQQSVIETINGLLRQVGKTNEKQAFRVAFNLDEGLDPGLSKRRDALLRELTIETHIDEKSIRNREDRARRQIASHLAGLFKKNMDKEESGDEEVADEFPGLMLVDQSPFAHDFHLDGFNWEELTVRITFDSAVERFEVHEDHSIVATKDGLERVGFVMFPASFFVAAGKEMLDDGGGLFGRGWRRPDTIGHLSDDIAIRTIWLEHPHVSGERIHVTRTYLLQPDACCYVLAPLAPVKRLGIRLGGSGEPGDNAGELMSWVIPGILPQFVPQLIAEYPFDPDTSQSSEATFQPQHYCWARLEAISLADENSCQVAVFEQLNSGLSYGVGWVKV